MFGNACKMREIPMAWLNTYINKIGGIRQSGADTELSYRTAIDFTIKQMAKIDGS